MKRRTIFLVAASVVLVLVVAGVAYAAYFARTVAQSQTHSAAGAITVTPTPTSGVTATATSTTSTSSTSKDLQTYRIVPAQSTASYSVYENLIFQNKPNNDAVGTTHSVQGSFHIRTGDAPLVNNVNITVDLSTLQTDSPMRDNYVRRNSLQTDTYPNATFVSVSTLGLPATYTEGQPIHFQLVGNLTMHGKTNKATFDVQGKVANSEITGTATSTVYMTDYGIQPPNLANIAISQNKVLVTINFTAKAG